MPIDHESHLTEKKGVWILVGLVCLHLVCSVFRSIQMALMFCRNDRTGPREHLLISSVGIALLRSGQVEIGRMLRSRVRGQGFRKFGSFRTIFEKFHERLVDDFRFL